MLCDNPQGWICVDLCGAVVGQDNRYSELMPFFFYLLNFQDLFLILYGQV